MTTVKLIEVNIDNLTSMWRVVGEAFNSYRTSSNFDYSYVNNSQWPNRLWFGSEVTQEILAEAKATLDTCPTNFTIPYWGKHRQASTLFEEQEFEIKFRQTGMSLDLTSHTTSNTNVDLRHVSSEKQAKLWSRAFIQCFNYEISPESILRTLDHLDYYLVYSESKIVGTATLYRTGKIIGAHSIGILPAMRRRGFAKQIMLELINISQYDKHRYMVLQASEMGKGLYEKLGFIEQFEIWNYIRK